MSGSLWSHGLQHAWLPYPSPSPRISSNSCPLSEWCSLTTSSSFIPFSFCLQSFSESESFPRSLLFASGGQSIGASASASVLPMNNQGWFSFGLTSLISLLSQGLSRVLQHHNLKASLLQRSAFFLDQLEDTSGECKAHNESSRPLLRLAFIFGVFRPSSIPWLEFLRKA